MKSLFSASFRRNLIRLAWDNTAEHSNLREVFSSLHTKSINYSMRGKPFHWWSGEEGRVKVKKKLEFKLVLETQSIIRWPFLQLACSFALFVYMRKEWNEVFGEIPAADTKLQTTRRFDWWSRVEICLLRRQHTKFVVDGSIKYAIINIDYVLIHGWIRSKPLTLSLVATQILAIFSA